MTPMAAMAPAPSWEEPLLKCRQEVSTPQIQACLNIYLYFEKGGFLLPSLVISPPSLQRSRSVPLPSESSPDPWSGL